MAKVKLSPSYRELSAINLGKPFVRDKQLVPGKKYPISVAGIDGVDLSGTLQQSGVIGGLAALYQQYPDLPADADIEVDFDGTTIQVRPPGAPVAPPKVNPAAPPSDYVLDRKAARRIFISPYVPSLLNTWEPKGEPDIYMVFGQMAQFTQYRYCCAASKEVLDKLGITIEPKPDAVLIEEGTDRYLISEFEVVSSSFAKHGHNKDDIDLLVCWKDDVTDPQLRNGLPKVLALHALLQKLLETGEIEL